MAEAEGIDQAIEKLKKWQPHVVQVTTVDGDTRSVKIPEKRTKWESVKATLNSFKWVRLEAQNKRGHVLGVCSNDDEELGLGDVGPVAGVAKIVDSLTRIMLRAQDIALKRDRERMETVMAHQTKLVESVVGKFANMQRTQMAQLEMISDLMMQASGDGDGDTSSMYVGAAMKALLELNEPKRERPSAKNNQPKK